LSTFLRPRAWGRDFAAILEQYDHMAGMWLVGEDLPQAGNRVTLNRSVRDQFGQPVPNVHVDDHPNEVAMREHAYAAGESVYAAVDALRTFDLDLARETYLTAWGAAGLAEDVAARDVLVEICRAARALPSPPGAPRPRDLMLDGFAQLITEGHAAATPTLQRAVRAAASIPVEDVLRWGWMNAGASAAVWDHNGWLASCERQVQVVRDAGALAALPIHLTYLAMAIVRTGDFAGAASLVAEIDSVAAVTGSRFPPCTLLRLRALQGREDEASAAIASAIEKFGGQGTTALRAYWAAAVLDNVTFYWLTNTAVSSGRLYWESKVGFFDAKGVSIPAAVSVFAHEIYRPPRSWVERAYPKLVYFNEIDRGCHFAAWQEPALFAAEVRAGFRSLRG
jgi:hypothetical protein